MTAIVMYGDARHLILPDDSVDLIVTSPPYFALRSYQDGGEHYVGQIGDEPTPAEFIDALIDCTREWVRVLKPTGSLWVNLGDSFSKGQRIDGGFTAQDAAWLAGVIDSDGSISVRVDNGGRSHIAWTRVGQMRPDVVQRIGHVTGIGQVFQDKRGVWNWNAAAQHARWVLERVWPWLRIKQRQALAAIDLMEQKERRGRKGAWAPLTDDDIRVRELIRQAVLAWNRGEEFPDYEPPPAALVDLPRDARFVPPKSLLGIPWRYALRCIDDLGLILRAEVVWSKPNGLPESVTDRVRRSHEQWFHFTRSPRYYSAVDEIREAHSRVWGGKLNGGGYYRDELQAGVKDANLPHALPNPLGKLPGSVWTVPTEPLKVPAHLGIDHFAAFPTEWPRRIIMGWSPPGICTACGEGRRPVSDASREAVDYALSERRAAERVDATAGALTGGTKRSTLGHAVARTITGYACACSDTSARTIPAVVLDPFGGTGTTALVASVLGRVGISNDMSLDYCRLARWRTTDPGERAKALRVEKPPVELDGQVDLFDLTGGAA